MHVPSASNAGFKCIYIRGCAVTRYIHSTDSSSGWYIAIAPKPHENAVLMEESVLSMDAHRDLCHHGKTPSGSHSMPRWRLSTMPVLTASIMLLSLLP